MTLREDRTALFLALAAATLASCGGETVSAARQGVTVTVQPSSAQVAVGEAFQFAAAVTGTADVSVAWTVVEAGGGSIDVAGLYRAPSAAGTFHVRASSVADPAAAGVATVSVVPTAPVTVAIAPRTATVAARGTLAFTATVTNATDPSVTWSVQEPSGCGSITQAGVYSAPTAGATCHVVARSVADPTRSDVATVTVTPPPPPVAVAISPSPGAVYACQTLAFTATVTGASDTRVTWSVQEGAAGGTITTAGAYTAPANAGTYHVVAASVADPSSSAVAPVGVTDRIQSVSVSPGQVSLAPGETAQFTATVTTTCGTFVTTSTVTAPGTAPAN